MSRQHLREGRNYCSVREEQINILCSQHPKISDFLLTCEVAIRKNKVVSPGLRGQVRVTNWVTSPTLPALPALPALPGLRTEAKHEARDFSLCCKLHRRQLRNVHLGVWGGVHGHNKRNTYKISVDAHKLTFHEKNLVKVFILWHITL